MTDVERRCAAAKFAADWKGQGDEKQEAQAFWLALLQKVYSVDEPEKYISFELPVKLDHTSFIDGYIADTCVLIEQKGQNRYFKDVVYNNFPWPTPTDAQKAKIEQTAQAILDACALYPNASLADLYDETTMPVELRRAHQNNDRTVMQAYGFSVKDMTESKCVAELMRMYRQLTQDKG